MTDSTSKMQRIVAACSFTCLLPLAAFAQTEVVDTTARQFTVEVIVFRYADSVSAGTELFVPDPPPEPTEFADGDDLRVFGDTAGSGTEPPPVPLDASGNPVELDADGNPVELDADGNPVAAEPEPRADYVLLLDDELTMLSTWDRLDRIDAYEPLAHFGWHQQVVPFEEPVAIPFAAFGQPVAGLDGDFTLYLSRFLHLAVALALNANPNELEPADDPLLTYSDNRYLEPVVTDRATVLEGPTYFRIDEDRIFKSGDLRYFDHPRFGVLARIERIERPEPDDVDEPAPASTGAGTD